jgi:hypothetical protein
MPNDSRAPRRRLGRRGRRLLGLVGAAAVAVSVFAFLLPQFADYRDVWTVVRGLGWREWLLLAGATALNLLTFPPPWMAVLPGLRFRAGVHPDAGVDRALHRLAGRRGGGPGGLLLDAPLVVLSAQLGRPGGRERPRGGRTCGFHARTLRVERCGRPR